MEATSVFSDSRFRHIYVCCFGSRMFRRKRPSKKTKTKAKTKEDVRVFQGYEDYLDKDDGAFQCDEGGRSHCCPKGYALGGAHISDNDFACRKLPALTQTTEYGQDTGNQRQGMIACKNGDYQVGAHGEDYIICRHNDDIRLGEEKVVQGPNNMNEGGKDMTGCPQGDDKVIWVMVGMHESDNKRLCQPVLGWKRP